MNKLLTKDLNKDWKIDSDTSTKKKFDIDNLSFFTGLKEGELYITGEEKLKRAKGQELFGMEECFRLYEEEGQKTLRAIYDKYKVEWIEFLGTILLGPLGGRGGFCLCRDGGGSWSWYYGWLDDDRNASYPALVLASTLPSDTLPSLPNKLTLERIRERFYKEFSNHSNEFINPWIFRQAIPHDELTKFQNDLESFITTEFTSLLQGLVEYCEKLEEQNQDAMYLRGVEDAIAIINAVFIKD